VSLRCRQMRSGVSLPGRHMRSVVASLPRRHMWSVVGPGGEDALCASSTSLSPKSLTWYYASLRNFRSR
jgi:hypothetical protein